MVEKGGTVSAQLCTFQCILCVRTLTNKRVRYKKFLHEVARSWISEVQITAKSNSDDLQMQRSKQHQGYQNWIHQADCLVISEHTSWKKIIAGGKGEKKYHVRQCKVCAAQKKRSATRYMCKFCSVPLHKGSCFERYHTLRNY